MVPDDPIARENLQRLFKKYTGAMPDSITKLPPSGSYRQYYRMLRGNESVMGVYNIDSSENSAFIGFSKHFSGKNLPVPSVLMEDPEFHVYLLQDLGDTTLLKYLNNRDFPDRVTDDCLEMYRKVIKILPRFQVEGNEGLDYGLCYPRQAFDRQSMMWDLNYFKYYFLKLARVPFNEQNLENDFQTLVDFLLTAGSDYFMYRDFQSRNIMLSTGNEPFFIDYQGGRKGALQYDIASLLFEAKTRLPAEVREHLLDYYLGELSHYARFSKNEFLDHFYGYVYIRLMQALGAYGFRGLYERKELFLESIPPALNHLEWLLENVNIPVKLPELTRVWEYLTESEYIRQLAKRHLLLRININSFSYRRGIPADESANGGGFVFDCRSVHNPGRYEPYKALTGKDPEVKKFLDQEQEMESFLKHVYALVEQSVDRYLKRGFTNLMVNFGCTGGQHRSVYAAEKLRNYLKGHNRSNEILVTLRHREMEMRK